MNPRELAQRYRTDDNLLVYRREEDEYWVSDTYVAFRLEGIDYRDFRDKYNGYKTTTSIPGIEIGKVKKVGSGEWYETNANVESVIESNDPFQAYLTPVYTENSRLVIVEELDYIISFQRKFEFLIEEEDEIFYDGDGKIFVEDRAIIMCTRGKDDFKNNFWSTLEVLNEYEFKY